MVEVTFTAPGNLWLFALVPVAVVLHFASIWYTRRKALRFANFEVLKRATQEKAGVPMNLAVLAARVLVIASLVLAVSGATLWYEGKASESDYVLAIDASSSMLADDYSPNRLATAKNAAKTFLDSTAPNAKVGVVSFGGTSFIKQKPVDNLQKIRVAVEEIEVAEVGGTAIGEALVTSVNLLQNLERGKAVVLLTDGQNNVGISVDEAIAYARANEVSVFSIGVGTKRGGRFAGVAVKSVLDEEALKEIASRTGGRYYHAETAEVLHNAFKEIALETVRRISFNLQPFLMLLAAALLFIEWALANFKYARIDWSV